MMSDEIDYQALYEQVQAELETARLTILSMRQPKAPITLAAIRSFVNRNYILIVVTVMLLTFIVSSLKSLKSLFPPKEA